MPKKTAVFLILFGGILMSFNGILLRTLESANGFQVLFYRSIALSAVVLFIIFLKRKHNLTEIFSRLDRWDLMIGFFLGAAFSSYVFSILYTSVASTLFILATSPFIATLLSWVILHERPSQAATKAMVLALLGVLIMTFNGLLRAQYLGIFMAFVASLTFAATLVIGRRSYKSDILSGTLIGGLFSGSFGLIVLCLSDNSFDVSLRDFLIMLFMGGFAIGLGISLVTWATPFVPAPEISVLVLVESFLGPVWVWFFLGEIMTIGEMVGGMLVCAAVIYLSFILSNKTTSK